MFQGPLPSSSFRHTKNLCKPHTRHKLRRIWSFCQSPLTFNKAVCPHHRHLWIAKEIKRVKVLWASGHSDIMKHSEQHTRICLRWSSVEQSRVFCLDSRSTDLELHLPSSKIYKCCCMKIITMVYKLSRAAVFWITTPSFSFLHDCHFHDIDKYSMYAGGCEGLWCAYSLSILSYFLQTAFRDVKYTTVDAGLNK